MFVIKKLKEDILLLNENTKVKEGYKGQDLNNSNISLEKSQKQIKQEKSEWALQKDLFKDIVQNLNQSKKGQPMDLKLFTPQLPKVNNSNSRNEDKLNRIYKESSLVEKNLYRNNNNNLYKLDNDSFYDSILKKFNVKNEKIFDKNSLSMSIKVLKRKIEQNKVPFHNNIEPNIEDRLKSIEIVKRKSKNLFNNSDKVSNNKTGFKDNLKEDYNNNYENSKKDSFEVLELKKSKEKILKLQSPILSPKIKLRRPSFYQENKIIKFQNNNVSFKKTGSLDQISNSKQLIKEKPKYLKKLFLSPQKQKNSNKNLNLSLKSEKDEKDININNFNNKVDLETLVQETGKKKKNFFCCF